VVALVGQAYDALPQLNAALRDGSRVTADLQAMQAIAADPALQKRFMDTGAKLVATTPAQTAAFAAAERVKWKEAVEISGAKLD
jgi:chemosensory pili system protein ChpA (sensor histidine kinase/response regulator)